MLRTIASTVVFGLAAMVIAAQSHAQWTPSVPAMDGTPTFSAPHTPLVWTITCHRTQSSLAGYQDALNRVAALGPGWRLPTFWELTTLNPIGGEAFAKLQIRTGLYDYYWTSPNAYTLGCAFGNGFVNAQPTRFSGHNWVIAVK
jgi:hypothetical protein